VDVTKNKKMKYKILTTEDIVNLKLSEAELRLVDKELEDLLSKSHSKNADKKCCSECDCTGYGQGNPSTWCKHCDHSYKSHKC
jgi:hypothetical protein